MSLLFIIFSALNKQQPKASEESDTFLTQLSPSFVLYEIQEKKLPFGLRNAIAACWQAEMPVTSVVGMWVAPNHPVANTCSFYLWV